MQEEVGKEVGLVSGTLPPTASLTQACVCVAFLLVAANTSCLLLRLCSPCQGGPMRPPPTAAPQAWESIRHASLYFLSLCLSLGCGPPSQVVTAGLWLPLLSTHQVPLAGSRVGEGGAAGEEWVQLPRPEKHPRPAPHTHTLPTHTCMYLGDQLLAHQLLLTRHPSHHFLTGDGRRVLSLFHQKDLQDFDTLLLSADGGTLYVGAREAILALNIQDSGVPRLKSKVRRPGVKGVG